MVAVAAGRRGACLLALMVGLLCSIVVNSVPLAAADAEHLARWGQHASFRNALDDYVAKPDATFSWHVLRTVPTLGYTGYFLNVTSQTWLTSADVDRSVWWHYVFVAVPKDLVNKTTLTFYVTGGNNHQAVPDPEHSEDCLLGATIAMTTGTIGAVIFQIPNVPTVFYDDPEHSSRDEGSTQGYGWNHFVRDPTRPEWLVELPMVKSVFKGMDAVTEFVAQNMSHNIDAVMLYGASKRGWVTWLTTAVDAASPRPRIIAAVPIVMSALNFVANMHHYYRALGGWPFTFSEYMAQNFTLNLDNPNMQLMADIIDPLTYRDRFTMPYMLVSTTGDEFFMPDDTNFWWDKMAGRKHFLLVPNSEHSCATALPELVPSISSFMASVMEGAAPPRVQWTVDSQNGTIVLDTEAPPRRVVVWHADTISSDRRDFRFAINPTGCPYVSVKGFCIQPIVWHKTAAKQLSPTRFVASMDPPASGWRGFFMDVEMDRPGRLLPFRATTQLSVVPNTFPFPDCHGSDCQGTVV